jgi:UDP-glucose 4-epimerase
MGRIRPVRAVVTGGAGFIGSHLCEVLLDRGDEVHVVDNLATGRRENVPAGAELDEVDIRDARLAELFERVRPDVCFHLAAQADVGVSTQRPDYDAEVNVLGTLRVLEAARAVGARVVFSSTGGAIYGEVTDGAAREDDPTQPLSPYGTAKLCAEQYVETWNRLHGTRNVIVRYANVYGPRQDSGLEGGVVAIFLERLVREEPTVIFGDGEQVRDFIYVRDVADATIAALGRDTGVYNVGTGVSTTVNQLHKLCRGVTGVAAQPEHVEPRLGDVRRSVIHPGRAERELGWRASVPLEEGLHQTWEWTRKERA